MGELTFVSWVFADGSCAVVLFCGLYRYLFMVSCLILGFELGGCLGI